MFDYVPIVEWPSTEAQAATKWCALAVASYFAFVAARQSVATVTSSRPFYNIQPPSLKSAACSFVATMEFPSPYLSNLFASAIYSIKSVHCRNCGLFEARDTTEWDTKMIQMQNGIQERAQKQPLGGSIRCPKCREKTFKVTTPMCWICLYHVERNFLFRFHGWCHWTHLNITDY
jgi:hypothetical protein